MFPIPATRIAKFIAILVSPLAVYLVFLNVPQPLFSHHRTWGNIRIHSDRPIPPESRIYLDSARLLLARSPWNDTTQVYRIFVCQSRWRFALLTGRAYKVGGLNSVYMNRNIFVRSVNWESGRLINHSGKEVPGDRTLPYFFAHEMAHGITVMRLGRWDYYRLPAWKREGYADYLARPRFDFNSMREAFRNGEPKMDPFQSGFYWRYHLMVQYLLEVRKVGVDEMFRESFPVPELERELRARS
jgi:hypothetical protein